MQSSYSFFSVHLYVLFIFAVNYPIYGYALLDINVSHHICLFFTTYMLLTAIFFCILVKTQLTRKLVNGLVSEKFIVSTLGEHTLSKVVAAAATFTRYPSSRDRDSHI